LPRENSGITSNYQAKNSVVIGNELSYNEIFHEEVVLHGYSALNISVDSRERTKADEVEVKERECCASRRYDSRTSNVKEWA
jgi:hypothetical protein